MPRIRLEVEYVGTEYHGWQRQIGDLSTVQGVLEAALTHLCAHPVSVTAAGRTDKGVHACRQTVHFDTDTPRRLEAYVFGGNYFLPQDIRIHHAEIVPDAFHARFSAVSREYRYHILNTRVASAIFQNRVLWHPRPLDHHLMHEASEILIGEHDFTSFRAQGCQAKSPIKIIERCEVVRQKDSIYLNIKANSFLYNMVRNITGTLIKIGEKKKSVAWMQEVLMARSRDAAGVTIPPEGLYFMGANYPHKFANNTKNH